MIQIYKKDNINYDSNGDMTLFPKAAVITASINAVWTATMTHEIDSEGRWRYIQEDAVVKLPSFNGIQLFRIKKVIKKMSGIEATMYPIFFDSKKDCMLLDVRPTEKSGQEALDIMTASNSKYKGESNITSKATAYYVTKNLMEAINGEDENSFVNRWGGEICFDNYKVIINERIGKDNGVQILYGKNISDKGLQETINMQDVVTRIIPKAFNGYMIEGDAPWVDSELIDKYPIVQYGVMTFEDVKMQADEQESDAENNIVICNTQDELKAALTAKCQEQYAKGLDKPSVSISVDIDLLQNSELYEDVKKLEEISLGDTIHCKHSVLEVTTDSRAIGIEYDSVQKRVRAVTIGEIRYDCFAEISSVINRVDQTIRTDGTLIGQQVMGIINGVKAQLKAQSTVAQKQAVRAVMFEDLDPSSPTFGAMCIGTLGFEIASKRTADGRDWEWSTFGTGQGFFADFIVAGTMLADRIKGGTLELGGTDNGNGVAKVLDGKGNEIVRLDKDGVYAKGKYICSNADGSQTATLTEGALDFKNGSYIAHIRAGSIGGQVGIMIYPEQGTSVSKYLSLSANALRAQFGDVILRASSKLTEAAESLEVQKGGKGYAAKTGRAEYSDGTYLDIVNGRVVGGKTKEGTF